MVFSHEMYFLNGTLVERLECRVALLEHLAV